MKFSFLDHHRVRQILTILLIPLALLSIFPIDTPFFHWLAQNAVFVSLAYTSSGLIFLILNKTRIMFVCFGCSACISFFYHETKHGWFRDDHTNHSVIEQNAPSTGDHTRYSDTDFLYF